MGLVLGLTAGLAIAVLRELRETGLRTGVDVRRPCWSAIPGLSAPVAPGPRA